MYLEVDINSISLTIIRKVRFAAPAGNITVLYIHTGDKCVSLPDRLPSDLL